MSTSMFLSRAPFTNRCGSSRSAFRSIMNGSVVEASAIYRWGGPSHAIQQYLPEGLVGAGDKGDALLDPANGDAIRRRECDILLAIEDQCGPSIAMDDFDVDTLLCGEHGRPKGK